MKIIFLATFLTVSAVIGEQAAPYPPSGWRPEGAELKLPTFQTQKQYNPPNLNYIPPSAVETKTTEITTEPSKLSEEKSAAVTENAYFLVLPNSEPLVVPEVQTKQLLYTYSPVVSSAAYVSIPETTFYTSGQLQAVPASAYSPFLASYVVDW